MFSLLNDSEMWLDIEGYEGLYSVSNMGRVYSHITNKFLKQQLQCFGYFMVHLYKDTIRWGVMTHILVGNAFIGKRENGLSFDHIDRNRQNNCADNIRLATRLEQNINQDVQIRSKTGERCITLTDFSYRIRIIRNNEIVFNKYLSMSKFSLEDAVKIRDDFLKKNPTGIKIRNVEQNTL